MKQRHRFFLNLVFVVVVAVSATGPLQGSSEPILGGWSRIKDLQDPHVMAIGNYAVNEYNRRSKANLMLTNIVEGEAQVVAGMNYRLVLAVNGGDSSNYEAIVWEKPWENFINLTSFKPVKV